MIPHIYNGSGTISLMIDGVMKPIDTSHHFYNAIKVALKAGEWDKIPDLVNIKNTVEKAINSSTGANDCVTISGGEVFYKGSCVHSTLASRIVSMASEGFDIGHMVKFLENLMENPSYRSVTELYDFLESSQIPITENGTFLTYKKIRNDWTDIHTGTFTNTIGTTVKMPRNQVDEDSHRTCSSGLHVCAYGYLNHFAGGNDDRVVICEVNPKDVVAIPEDYDNMKMRVCEYTVIGEVTNYVTGDILANKSVVNTKQLLVSDSPAASTVSTGKAIGKQITEMLFSGLLLNTNDISDALCVAGLDAFSAIEVQDLVDIGKYKRVGKQISSYITDRLIDPVNFLKAVEDTCCGEELE